ncbi:hypothetical protein ACTXT7_017145, partial [Hymenolepis weldensis]
MTWALSQGQEVKSSRPTLRKSPSKFSSAKSGSPSECPHVEVEPSPYLLIHIHGGGFIALSSETHDVCDLELFTSRNQVFISPLGHHRNKIT